MRWGDRSWSSSSTVASFSCIPSVHLPRSSSLKVDQYISARSLSTRAKYARDAPIISSLAACLSALRIAWSTRSPRSSPRSTLEPAPAPRPPAPSARPPKAAPSTPLPLLVASTPLALPAPLRVTARGGCGCTPTGPVGTCAEPPGLRWAMRAAVVRLDSKRQRTDCETG